MTRLLYALIAAGLLLIVAGSVAYPMDSRADRILAAITTAGGLEAPTVEGLFHAGVLAFRKIEINLTDKRVRLLPRPDDMHALSDAPPAHHVAGGAAHIEKLHDAWEQCGRDSEHPVLRLVQQWQTVPRSAKPFVPRRRASLPLLSRLGEDAVQLPDFARRPQPQLEPDLPGLMPPTIEDCPSWLLWLYDRAGGESMKQERGAPWDMRLFVGAMLHLPVDQRDDRPRALRFKTQDIERWLHPGGWDPSNRRKYFHWLPEALHRIDRDLGWVPIPGYGRVRLLSLGVIPEKPDDPIVEFWVRIPRVAAHGDRIDWPTLQRYGKHSAALYRAYLSAVAYMGRTARHGQPITKEIAAPVLDRHGRPMRRKKGRIIRSATEREDNPAASMVRPLSNSDLARLIGFDGGKRDHRYKARNAFAHLDADGVIDLRRDGKGVRIFGPDRAR